MLDGLDTLYFTVLLGHFESRKLGSKALDFEAPHCGHIQDHCIIFLGVHGLFFCTAFWPMPPNLKTPLFLNGGGHPKQHGVTFTAARADFLCAEMPSVNGQFYPHLDSFWSGKSH